MPQATNEYSSHVEIWLEVNGQCLSVAQVGDGSLILRNGYRLSPSQYGKIILTVDGEDRIYPVVIRPSDHDRIVEFERCDPDQGTLF